MADMNENMVIDHICFAVKELQPAADYWCRVFDYHQKTRIITNTRQKVKVVFISKPGSLTIKLIEPLETNRSLIEFVSRGGGFHHICFKCSDMGATISDLKTRGLIMLVPPQPGEAFNNHDIAFLLTRNGLNIELIDTDEKAGIL